MGAKINKDIERSILYIAQSYPRVNAKLLADFFSVDCEAVAKLLQRNKIKPDNAPINIDEFQQLINFMGSYRYKYLNYGMIC